jgi:hypothetical protein
MKRRFLRSPRSPLVMVLLAVLAGVTTAVWTFGGTAHAQPSLTVSPPSGPCDATVQVSGSGFERLGAPAQVLVLYLLQPGTADVNMGSLNAVVVKADGNFATGLGDALDKRRIRAMMLSGNEGGI